MKSLETLLRELEDRIPHFNHQNKNVSKTNVGWHIEHTLLVVNKLTSILISSNPDNYKWKFNFLRFIVFTTNKIPRGKGKSPKAVMPKTAYNQKSLLALVAKTKDTIETLKTIPKDKFFDHHVFGMLRTNKAKKFIAMHTKHHLNIIDDILKDDT